jgi:hypothetical protein
MANELIASPLIWNCMTSKYVAYENEREVRLVLMGQTSNLSPYVKTRLRGSETVPYIAHPFRIRETGAIHENRRWSGRCGRCRGASRTDADVARCGSWRADHTIRNPLSRLTGPLSEAIRRGRRESRVGVRTRGQARMTQSP